MNKVAEDPFDKIIDWLKAMHYVVPSDCGEPFCLWCSSPRKVNKIAQEKSRVIHQARIEGAKAMRDAAARYCTETIQYTTSAGGLRSGRVLCSVLAKGICDLDPASMVEGMNP